MTDMEIDIEFFRKMERVMGDEIERLRAERDAAMKDAERYRYLRNRNSSEVLRMRGFHAGCWIDCEDEFENLVLLTGDDADAAIDAAKGER